MNSIVSNKIFQVFLGVLVLVVVIFFGIITVANYYSHKDDLANEISDFKQFKQNQIEKDMLKINQEISKSQSDEYSDYNNHHIETPDNIVQSINGGYCSESIFPNPEKNMCYKRIRLIRVYKTV